MKIEKENVAIVIDTGASVSILNKKTCDLICRICRNSSANLLPISSKLMSYSEELIHRLGKIVCMVSYIGQLCHHLFVIVDDKRIYWGGICCVLSKSIGLTMYVSHEFKE